MFGALGAVGHRFSFKIALLAEFWEVLAHFPSFLPLGPIFRHGYPHRSLELSRRS